MSGKKEVYYHYTTERGVDAIMKSGVIRASRSNSGRSRDAAFGDGVYLTKKDPQSFSKEELAQNNYDSKMNTWETLLKRGKVDYAIEMELPRRTVSGVPSNRDIHLHEGDIDLSDVDYNIVQVPH